MTHLTQIAKYFDAAGSVRFIERTAERLIMMDTDDRCFDYQRFDDGTFSLTTSRPHGRWRWLRCVLFNAVK